MLGTVYRFVGGFIPLGGTQKQRAVFCVIMAAAVAFAMIVKGFGYADVCTVFVSSFFLTFAGRFIPHGWTWQIPVWGYLYMSLIATVRVGLWLAPAFYFMPNLTPIFLLGLISGGMYAIGRNFLDGVDSGFYYVKKANLVKYTEAPLWVIESPEEPSVYAKGWTEWGEVLTGVFCYSLPMLFLLAL